MAKSHPGACEIRTVRLLKHKRATVFAAWQDKKALDQWWPDHGFKRIFHVKENERIEFDHNDVPKFLAIVTFVDEFQNTKVTLRMMFKTPKECEAEKVTRVAETEATFDRLDAFLKSLPA